MRGGVYRGHSERPDPCSYQTTPPAPTRQILFIIWTEKKKWHFINCSSMQIYNHVGVLWTKMPCWRQRSELIQDNTNNKPKVWGRAFLNTQHIKPWSRWATTAEKHSWWQTIANSHRITKTGRQKVYYILYNQHLVESVPQIQVSEGKMGSNTVLYKQGVPNKVASDCVCVCVRTIVFLKL